MRSPRRRSPAAPSPTYIRQWRKFRGLELQQLAEMTNMDIGHLSRIERGLRPYNQEQIEAIALALKTTVGALVSRAPQDAEAEELWRIWDELSDETRAVIRAMIAAANFAKKK
jgi:transcriptional regulator with XRE-family HTH domain